MCVRILLVEFHSAARRGKRRLPVSIQIFAPFKHDPLGEDSRQGCKSRRESRVQLDCTAQESRGVGIVFGAELMETPQATHVVVPGVHGFRTLARRPLLLDPPELGLYRADDAAHDFILHGEGVGEIPVIAFGPYMGAGRRLDELSCYPHAVACLAHTPLKNVAHPQLAPDLFDVDGPALVGETRVARDDEEPTPFREGGDDVLADPVGEVLLLRVAAHVLEWQNGYRRFVWKG